MSLHKPIHTPIHKHVHTPTHGHWENQTSKPSYNAPGNSGNSGTTGELFSDSDDGPFDLFLWIGLVLGLPIFLTSLLSAWETYAFPFNYVAAYYYYILIVPLGFILQFLTSHINSHELLKSIFIPIIAVTSYSSLFWGVKWLLIKIGLSPKLIRNIIFLPGLLSLAWLFFAWLFS